MRLELSNISVRLPGMAKPLFSVKKLQINSGARVLVQGPSGKGKTTLLHLLAGLVDPTEGTVAVDERTIGGMSEAERAAFRRENVGIIFQKLSLIPHLTARENVQLGQRTDHGRGRSASDATAADAKGAVESALGRVKLLEHADVLAQSLSLGQAQRVAVARVLAQAPRLVLADEPTSSLDDENANAVMKSLFALKSSTTIIVVSHDHRIRSHFDDVRDFDQLVRA